MERISHGRGRPAGHAGIGFWLFGDRYVAKQISREVGTLGPPVSRPPPLLVSLRTKTEWKWNRPFCFLPPSSSSSHPPLRHKPGTLVVVWLSLVLFFMTTRETERVDANLFLSARFTFRFHSAVMKGINKEEKTRERESPRYGSHLRDDDDGHDGRLEEPQQLHRR